MRTDFDGVGLPQSLARGTCLSGNGVEPTFTIYSGDNPLKFVISLNLRRRHLNENPARHGRR
jgi:hypothetical protein